MKILAWDIETSPALGYFWGLWDQNIGLNQLMERGEILSFAARWIDAPKKDIYFASNRDGGHEAMIGLAWDLIDEADALVSWNGRAFDTKNMNREFLLAGMTPPSPAKEIDLMVATKKRFRFVSNKLENVAQELGLGGKVKHSGFGLWIRCMNDEPAAWAEMEKYNKQDVHLLVDLYRILLPWIDNHPNRNLFDGDGCPACGSTRLQARGTRTTQLGSYQRYQCIDCGKWSSSGKAIHRVDIREDK
jgi:hypothetical protein